MSGVVKYGALFAGAVGLCALLGQAALAQGGGAPPNAAPEQGAVTPQSIDAALKRYETAVDRFEKQFVDSAKDSIGDPAPKDPRDFEGVWKPATPPPDPADAGVNGVRGAWRPVTAAGLSRALGAQFLPLNAKGLAGRENRLALTAAGHPVADPANDCRPHSMPKVMAIVQLVQIYYAPGVILMLWNEGMNTRVIHMDDQPAPANEPLSYMGYSRGHWDGNTLIIDTDHLTDKSLLDDESLSHGVKLKVHEEITKFTDKYGGEDLRDLITIFDPDYFTRPFTSEKLLMWDPKEDIIEFSCEENSRNQNVNGGQAIQK